MIRSILYATDNYRVVSDAVSADAPTMVIFDHWVEAPDLLAESPGGRFFVQQGINVVGIKTARNDWYQSLELRDICAIVAAIPGRRIGYGGSMGAYAAINFADYLALDMVIAVCPQVSIDPMKVPFERRWLAEGRTITFVLDQVERPRAGGRARGFVVFDPNTVDRLHVDRILSHHDLVPVRIYWGGHDQMLMLQQCDVFAGMLIDMVHGRFDPPACLAAVRRRRRKSSVFWLNFAQELVRHGRYDAAEDALSRARACSGGNTPSFHWQLHAAITGCLVAAAHGGRHRPRHRVALPDHTIGR